MRTVRVTAKTVEAAVEDGIKQLGISREEAIVHVVEQPSGGLFGLIHKKPAVVDVSAVDEPEAEETPEAPKAGEKPCFAASNTIPKHIAKETISNVSLPIHLRERFRKIGIRYIPTTNQRIRKNTNLPIL